MADALVSLVLENLNSLAQDEIRSFLGVTKELEKISSKFTTIQAVLDDAEKKQIQERSVRDWLAKLKNVAYDIDDILDEWKTEALISEIHTSVAPESKMQVCNYYFFSPCFCFNQVVFRRKMGHRIKGIRERLDEIAKEKSEFHLEVGGNTESRSGASDRQTSSLLDETQIVGRIREKNYITNFLLHESSTESEVSVISIVGMGGLGKTFLAQLVYNHETVKSHFEIRMWVCVSDDFDVLRLSKSMIKEATKENSDSMELQPLQCRLQEIVNGKRFLLVLDDVWSEDYEKWEKLVLPLKHSARGSRIVVTTRNEKVSNTIGAKNFHLDALPKEECWSLFSQRAFQGRSEEECLELEGIGNEIVEKCKGLPLAAKTMGGVMRFKRTKQEWENVKQSEIWNLEDVEKNILPALILSYQDLPSHLKQCFQYCSIFPKDYIIGKDLLIKMWIAHGFIIPKGSIEMEELGGSYFYDLFWRSFFQDPRRDDFGKIVSCKMHDLVHDLAQYIAKNECIIMETGKLGKVPTKVRHSSLICNNNQVESIPNALFNNTNSLRTMACIGERGIDNVPLDFFHYSRCLRVLDLSYSKLKELPNSIGKLKHLRYLDLSRTDIEELPESMSSLCNLMILRLVSCFKLQKLPKDIGKMVSLRHIEIMYTDELEYMPNGMERISCLRTLDRFIVGGDQNGCKIGAMKNLNLLQGGLVIEHLERVADGDDAKEAELKEKKYLDALTLHCNEFGEIQESEVVRMEGVFEGLQPHTNLKELVIHNYIGHKFPNWMVDSSFSNLREVLLSNCCNCKHLPPLGQLPSLKLLDMHIMEEVKCVGRDFYGVGRVKGFPKLETLNFTIMSDFEEWDLRVEQGEMPCLIHLTIYECPKLKTLPQLPCTLETLEIWNCSEISSLPDDQHNESGHTTEKKTLFPSLKSLSIKSCPLLAIRCQEGGKDWHKISHVPDIEIDSQQIQK